MSARPLDPTTVEARFTIADGYYLYRDKLKLTVERANLAAAPTLPAGKMKQDEFFGNVETYRGELVVRLPLEKAAPGNSVALSSTPQSIDRGRSIFAAYLRGTASSSENIRSRPSGSCARC